MEVKKLLQENKSEFLTFAVPLKSCLFSLSYCNGDVISSRYSYWHQNRAVVWLTDCVWLWGPLSPGFTLLQKLLGSFVLAEYHCRYQLLYALSTGQSFKYLDFTKILGIANELQCMNATVPRVRANMEVNEKTGSCLKNP